MQSTLPCFPPSQASTSHETHTAEIPLFHFPTRQILLYSTRVQGN